MFDPISYSEALRKVDKSSELSFAPSLSPTLPNGTTNTVDMTENTVTKAVSDKTPLWDFADWSLHENGTTEDFYSVQCPRCLQGKMNLSSSSASSNRHRYILYGYPGERTANFQTYNSLDDYASYVGQAGDIRIKVPRSAYATEWTLQETLIWLEQNNIQIVYELAEPRTMKMDAASPNTQEILFLSSGRPVQESLDVYLDGGGIDLATGAFLRGSKATDVIPRYCTGKFLSVTPGTELTVSFPPDGGVVSVIEYDRAFSLVRTTQGISSGSAIPLSGGTRYIKFDVVDAPSPPVLRLEYMRPQIGFKWVKNQVAPIDSTWFTYDVQYNGATYRNQGIIKVPPNYDVFGEPSRLIIFCTGSKGSYYNYFHFSSGYRDYIDYLVREGYAVATFWDWTTKYIDLQGGNNFGSPITMAAIEQGYRWIVENFNIRTDGAFVFGKSAGGRKVGNLVSRSGIPLLAAAMLAPALAVTKNRSWEKYAFGYSLEERMAYAEDFGFDIDGDPEVLLGSTGQYPAITPEFISFMEANLPKTLGYAPLWNGLVDADLDQLVDMEIDPYGAGYDESYYQHLKRVIQTPVKVWMAMDDSREIEPHQMLAYVKSIREANGIAEVRLMPDGTGGHNSVDSSPLALRTSGVTKLGEPYNDIPLAYVEMVQWFRRFGD